MIASRNFLELTRETNLPNLGDMYSRRYCRKMAGPLHVDEKFFGVSTPSRSIQTTAFSQVMRINIRYRIIAAAILLIGLETTADAFIPLSARIHRNRRAGTPTGTTASGWSDNRYHHSHHHCSFTFAAKRFNDEENDGDEDEDPIFNDSLIYYTPGQMDYARKSHTNGAEVDANMSVLRDRMRIMLVGETLENQIKRPPRNDLGPIEFVEEILSALIEPDDPLPDSGLGVLFHASTRRWRALLRQSVGAPADADSGTIGRSLNHAISRERNQFGILVGADDAEEYVAVFPGEGRSCT